MGRIAKAGGLGRCAKRFGGFGLLLWLGRKTTGQEKGEKQWREGNKTHE
jgi:hypothetical protein